MKSLSLLFFLFFINIAIANSASAFSESDWAERYNKRSFNMTLGFKSNILFIVDTLNHGDINFIGNHSSGFGYGGGIYSEFTFFRVFAFETGFYYRTSEYSGWEVDYDEIFVPMILKGRIQIDETFSFLIGGGIGYFNTLSGSVDPTGSGPGQSSLALKNSELSDGISIIFLLETQIELYKKHLVIGLQYERAKKVLDIVENQITFEFGIGFKLF